MAQKDKLFLILISLALVGFFCSVLLFMNQAVDGIAKNTAMLKSGLVTDNTKLFIGGLLEPIKILRYKGPEEGPEERIMISEDTPEVLQGKWRLIK